MYIDNTKEVHDLFHEIVDKLEKEYKGADEMAEKKRVTVYIDEEVLELLDSMKEEHNISRSELLNIAATEYSDSYINKLKNIKEYKEMKEVYRIFKGEPLE